MLFLRSLPILSLCLLPVLTGVAHAQNTADIMLRLDRMEADNRRLNGTVEELSNQIRRMDDQFKRFQSDVDFRFKESGGSKPAAPESKKRADAPENGGGGSGGGKTIGQLATETTGSTSIKSDGSARGDYQTANALLGRGDNEAAEVAFRDFLRSHAKDKLKPDALYGLGESYYRRNRYREAAEQYLSVTTDYSKSPRAPEAMLKLGMSLRGMGAKVEACGTYSEVIKKYPNASPAIRQAVEREKKRAQCA